MTGGCETKRKGDACEAHVLAVLVQAGLIVLVPWGDNASYDLVVHLGGRFLRIQCKTGQWLEHGCVAFNTYRVLRKPARVRYQPGEFEYYGVWCRQTGMVYLVPFEAAAGSYRPYLRVDMPRPGSTGGRQKTNVRWASKYQVDVVIESWLRTGGDLDPVWSAPALGGTGQWHPSRQRLIQPVELASR